MTILDYKGLRITGTHTIRVTYLKKSTMKVVGINPWTQNKLKYLPGWSVFFTNLHPNLVKVKYIGPNPSEVFYYDIVNYGSKKYIFF